jgi:hypothetical protein
LADAIGNELRDWANPILAALLYYRLSWKKASGARLDMLWRFEQGFDAVNGWGAPGTQDGTTGLIWADIRPAPPSRIEP